MLEEQEVEDTMLKWVEKRFRGPGLERSPGEGKGDPLQYSGLEDSMDSTVHGAAKSRTRLSNFHFHFCHELSSN